MNLQILVSHSERLIKTVRYVSETSIIQYSKGCTGAYHAEQDTCSIPGNDCVAFTYTLDTCILYSNVFAVFDTDFPAFSALLVDDEVCC